MCNDTIPCAPSENSGQLASEFSMSTDLGAKESWFLRAQSEDWSDSHTGRMPFIAGRTGQC